jgi:hypothetical protein
MRKPGGKGRTIKESKWFLVFVQFHRYIKGIDFTPEFENLLFFFREAKKGKEKAMSKESLKL